MLTFGLFVVSFVYLVRRFVNLANKKPYVEFATLASVSGWMIICVGAFIHLFTHANG